MKLSGREDRLKERMLVSQKPNLMEHTADLGRVWFFASPGSPAGAQSRVPAIGCGVPSP